MSSAILPGFNFGPEPIVQPTNTESECDVLEHREVRKQGIVLEDGLDGAEVGRVIGHILAFDQNASIVRFLESRDKPECGRFSASRWPEKSQELSLQNRQGNAVGDTAASGESGNRATDSSSTTGFMGLRGYGAPVDCRKG